MADQPKHPVGKLIARETEQQRVERVRNDERKAHAAVTQKLLRQRYGIPEDSDK